MNGGTVNQSVNGSSPDPDRRRAAVGFVATASSATDRRARNEHVAVLEDRVAKCEADCNDARARITAAEERQDAIPDHKRGWPLEVVAVLALISILFEYIPASLFTQVFTSATATWQLVLLTVAFTTMGVLLALFLGELLRRMKEPVRHDARETVLLVVVALFTIGFLVLGYELRYAFTSHSKDALLALSATVEAFALTAIATIGIALTLVSSYFREGIETFKVRKALGSLRSELASNEKHLGANRRDLKRARGSPSHAGERRASETDPAQSSGRTQG